MLDPISLYLGKQFQGGLRKPLDFAGLIPRCSQRIVLHQHLFPKQMKRMSLSMKSFLRRAISLLRPFVNITINLLFKETDYSSFHYSWPVTTLQCFLHITCIIFACFVTVGPEIINTFIISYARLFVSVWFCLSARVHTGHGKPGNHGISFQFLGLESHGILVKVMESHGKAICSQKIKRQKDKKFERITTLVRNRL